LIGDRQTSYRDVAITQASPGCGRHRPHRPQPGVPSGIEPAQITLVDGPVELVDFYAAHRVFIARARRNATAEALHRGILTVPISIAAHRHCGSLRPTTP
jgi:hypothetical protein